VGVERGTGVTMVGVGMTTVAVGGAVGVGAEVQEANRNSRNASTCLFIPGIIAFWYLITPGLQDSSDERRL
jgi:hypothetical protein